MNIDNVTLLSSKERQKIKEHVSTLSKEEREECEKKVIDLYAVAIEGINALGVPLADIIRLALNSYSNNDYLTSAYKGDKND